jgi:crotonobetaine/carnitine-CoA ligase
LSAYHEFLAAGAERHGEREALRIEGVARTYAELLGDALGLTAGLAAAGIGREDHVAIMMDSSHAAVDAWLASSVLGCTEVPVNSKYRGDLLGHLLTDSESTVVICDDTYLPALLAVPLSATSIKAVVVNSTGAEASRDCGGPVVHELADLKATGGSFPAAPGDGGCVVLYTSGTTGPSKGVMHSQASTLTLARFVARTLGYTADDALLNFFPLYHMNARYTALIPALAVGARLQLDRRFSTSTFWSNVRAGEITAFNYLGSVLTMIMSASRELTPGQARDHRVRKAYGSGAPRMIWAEFEERFGIELFEAYGLSEAPMATLNTPPRVSPVGSAGRASELFEVRVLDERGSSAAAEEVGEIAVRPKVPDAFMRGYYGRDADTVRATRDLWFHTGDRGRLSTDGDLYFEERAKDSIRRRGENISAWEVESVLDRHPKVAESAVYGIKAEQFDEEVMAAVVAVGADVDPARVIEECAPRLPGYAVPRYVRVLDELPRTDTMKVQKAELRRAGITADTVDLAESS